ncbi:hypothetical protein M3Y95_00952200 [Aphelenchoides besseyi]|nr:hypothetical protein M3Y95_00952200 [Aphelenchoides besseyi]
MIMDTKAEIDGLNQLFNGQNSITDVGIQFLDGLIKLGEMELAKGAFKTQLELLQRVHPEKYKNYEKVPIELLAAEALQRQLEHGKSLPKSGNKLLDMLNANGLQLSPAINRIESGLKIHVQPSIPTTTQSAVEIGKQMFERVQRHLLPGIVGSIIKHHQMLTTTSLPTSTQPNFVDFPEVTTVETIESSNSTHFDLRIQPLPPDRQQPTIELKRPRGYSPYFSTDDTAVVVNGSVENEMSVETTSNEDVSERYEKPKRRNALLRRFVFSK